MRLASIVCLAWPLAASADPHPMASGAVPGPGGPTDVAMTDENLTIALGLRDARVHAAIAVENKGTAPAALVVGFPCAAGASAGTVDVPCKVPLTIAVDGKRVRATPDRRGAQQTHWQWPMKLAAGARAAIDITYTAPLLNDRYSLPASGMGLFTYRLTTGADWAGPIGKLRITLEHAQEALLYIAPAGYQRELGTITWSLDAYEPTEEVVIMPEPRAGGVLLGAIGGKTVAELRARLAAGDVSRRDLERVIAALKDRREWGEEWWKTITRLGGVPAPTAARVEATAAESIKLLEALAARAKR